MTNLDARGAKKGKDVDYKPSIRVFQKYFVVHEHSAVKNSFSTYVCYAPDGSFWLNLYVLKFMLKLKQNAAVFFVEDTIPTAAASYKKVNFT